MKFVMANINTDVFRGWGRGWGSKCDKDGQPIDHALMFPSNTDHMIGFMINPITVFESGHVLPCNIMAGLHGPDLESWLQPILLSKTFVFT